MFADWIAYCWAILVLLFIGFRIGYHYGDRDAREEIRARIEEVHAAFKEAHPEDFTGE